MSLMPTMAATGARTATFNAAGASDPTGIGNLEQMFARLMQQIQTAMEQPINGSNLPPDGEPLPSELFARLGAELAPEQRQQLDDLITQLTAEAMPQGQIETLAQAALLVQDAQLERRADPDPLLQLVDVIRATSAGALDDQEQRRGRQGRADEGRSIDQLLALADRLRTAAAPIDGVATAMGENRGEGSEGRQGDAVLVDSQVARVADAAVAIDGAVDNPGSDIATAAAVSTAADVVNTAAAVSTAADVVNTEVDEPTVDRISEGRQALLAAESVSGSVAKRAVPVAPSAASPAVSLNLGSGSSVRLGLEDVPATASGRQGDASDQDSQQQGRRESLSRWVELRDSVVSQGSKLAQNDSVFKGLFAAQSGLATGEAGPLAQATRAGSLAQLQQTYQTPAASQLALGVGERFGSSSWTPAASQRILWMAGQNVSSVELRLDPPELGSLTVRLQIQGDQASLSFTSPHAHVREVLEQQMSRLRDMLSENGIELEHSDVSDQPLTKESAGEGFADSQQQSTDGDIDSENQQDASSLSAPMSLSLVDYYA